MSLLRPYVKTRTVCRYYSSFTTLSEEEMQKFSKLSKEWWDINGPFKGLHSLNMLRVPFVRKGIQTNQRALVKNAPAFAPLTGCRILDVGCGGGIMSESLARIGANVTAIDPNEECIKAASLHAQKSNLENLTYQMSTVEEYQALNAAAPLFDAITTSEVIEHVDNPDLFINTCSQLLKPGGSIFLTTINRTTASWLLAICAAEYVLNIVPRGTHDWNKFITPVEITSHLQNSGCQLRELYGMRYNPLTNTWSWTMLDIVNYAVHATKVTPQLTVVEETREPTIDLNAISPPENKTSA